MTRLLTLGLALSLGACGSTQPSAVKNQEAKRDAARAARAKAACSSDATYDRLKQIVFDQAIRIKNDDPVNLDLLSTHTLVRVENPVVKSRDDALDVTVCSGRLILHIPPGAEGAFGGKRQLIADIEYAAQAAADGSGLAYRITGAEPVISSLAAFDLQGRSYRPAAPKRAATAPELRPDASIAQSSTPPAPAVATAAPARNVSRQAAPSVAEAAPSPRPARGSPTPTRDVSRQASSSSPSFSCRGGRSRSERMVCSSDRLASLDRTMSSQFYSRLGRSDRETRAELRRSRDQFLARRERCSEQECVAQVYRDRMDEIDEIAAR